jgi:hypothetical protein
MKQARIWFCLGQSCSIVASHPPSFASESD